MQNFDALVHADADMDTDADNRASSVPLFNFVEAR